MRTGPSLLRPLSALVLPMLLLGGCGAAGSGATPTPTPSEDPAGALAALEYLGDGTRAEYRSRIEAASSEEERDAILREATMVSGVVGTALVLRGSSPVAGETLELEPDGSVSASSELLRAFMSNATHWELGDTTLELCPDEDCEYSASWRVTVDPTEGASAPYVLTLQAHGEDTAVTRSFGVAP